MFHLKRLCTAIVAIHVYCVRRAKWPLMPMYTKESTVYCLILHAIEQLSSLCILYVVYAAGVPIRRTRYCGGMREYVYTKAVVSQLVYIVHNVHKDS